jgi:hypothetical protein
VSAAPAITSTTQALDLLDGALAYLSAADAAQLPAVIQAQCLAALERADARATAARASILAAFTSGQGYCEDADYSPRSWLIQRTRVTRATAADHAGWARRTRTHPRILAALAAGDITRSWARTICGWTDQLPEDCRDNADAILAAAAVGGLGLRDLAELAAEMQAQSRPPDEDGPRFEDRALRLETTFGGTGVLNADLTPECAAVLTAMLTPDHSDPDHIAPDHIAPDHSAAHHTNPDHSGPDPVGPGEPLPGPQPLPPGLSRESLEQTIIGKAVALLSGPGGLASFLRRRQLGARLGGPSQPLDIGYSNDIPAAIRNAVKLRDRHCQWAGGCDQPASACEVHHVRHKGRGGKTSLDNCLCLCFYHHQVVIHRMGWTLVRNPDGTTTAWNPDRTKVLRSHGPPARAG